MNNIEEMKKEFEEKFAENVSDDFGLIEVSEFVWSYLQPKLKESYQSGWNKGNIDGQETGVRNERKNFIVKHIPNLLTQQRDEAILDFATDINKYAMHKKEVWGEDNEYFITMDEMHRLLIEYRLSNQQSLDKGDGE